MIPMPPVNEETIRQAMDRRARETPDDIYCRFEGRAWRFAEMGAAVNRLPGQAMCEVDPFGERAGLGTADVALIIWLPAEIGFGHDIVVNHDDMQ